MLLVKKGERFQWKPRPLKLNSDAELQNTTQDPLKNSMLYNHMPSSTMKTSTVSWRGSREISAVLYQIIVDMCSSPEQIVVDIIASTSALARACQASWRHFFGFEVEKDIYNALLRPLCDSSDSDSDDDDDTDEDLRACKNDWIE